MCSSKGFLIAALVQLILLSASHALPTQFRVHNRSNEPYQGLVDVVLPIPPGEVTNVTQLQNILADGQPTVIKPIKYHRINSAVSIAAVRLTTQISLSAQEQRVIQLSQGANSPPHFILGPGIAAIGPEITNYMVIGARIGTGPECYATLAGPQEILDINRMNFTVRWRVHPNCGNGVTLPLTITTYLRLGSGNDHARMTLLVGNDTLERPVPGGITSTEVFLYLKDPVNVAFHQPQAFGGLAQIGTFAGYKRYQLVKPSDVIADGSRLPFFFNIGVGPVNGPAYRSMVAASQNPANQMLGFVSYDDYRTSHTMGLLGVIPRPRFTDINAARAALEPLCQPLGALSADDFKGTILQHPYFTGGQGDFTASLPVFAQQIAHTGSSCPLMKTFVGVAGEWIRRSASSYWSFRDGKERPVKIDTIPNLMLWNDGIHQISFYNGSEFQHYIQRIGMDPGTSKFSSWDEEHHSFNSQAAVALFVGSEDLLDLLRLHLRTIYFNHYNWYRFPAIVAPRAIGRTGQEVMMLYPFFADELEANIVYVSFANKIRDVIYPYMVSQNNQYGFPNTGAGNVNAAGGIWTQCLSGAFPEITNPNSENCANVYAWHNGFVIEALVQLRNSGLEAGVAQAIINDLLDDHDLYFLPNGEPKTHVLRSNPSRFDIGGIGPTWWAGYAAAAATTPSHPRSQDILNRYVNNILTPAINGAAIENTYWRNSDNWNVFEDLATRTYHAP